MDEARLNRGSTSALPSAAVEHDHAGFVSRFIALAIDLVGLAVVVSAANWFLVTLDEVMRPWARLDLSTILLWSIPIIIVVYFAGSWRLSGQTVGKWLLGLKVVSVDGGRVSTGRATLRVFGYVLSAVPLYAGFLWVLLDPERRALHDRLSFTVVVYTTR